MARDNDDPSSEGLVLLPTGKPHISFSELSDWVACSFRHKLKYIDGIVTDDRSHYLDFGIAVHAANDNYLRTRRMDTSIALDIIRSTWEKYGYAEKEGDIANLDACLNQAEEILKAVPDWLEATFPGWRCLAPEHRLYERIGDKPHAFKGFIDAVLEVEQTIRGKQKTFIWLLDWKTTTWGWDRYKKQDQHRKRQLIYYKHYWAQQMGMDPKDIRCGFVLLKRTAAQRCELLPVSVGEVSTQKSLKLVDNMLSSVKRGLALKNKYSCDYCPYRDTIHCP